MSQEDSDTDAFLEHQAKRMMSLGVYHKLKLIVDAWRHEERGKIKVTVRAVYALAAWLIVFIASAFVLPAYSGLVVAFGLLAWMGFVFWLIHKYLGASR